MHDQDQQSDGAAAMHCIPCSGKEQRLSDEEIRQQLMSVPGWQIASDGGAIYRRWAFSDFAKALAFVNEVAVIAEKEHHHPDIEFGWGYAVFKLSTHAIGGLHRNDFIIASKINDL